MAFRVAHLGLVSLVTLPLLQMSCGGSEDRTFTPTKDGGTTGGSGGNTGGSAGTSTGGGSGGVTGGSGGVSGSGTGGVIGDAGTPCTDSTECTDGNSCNGDEICTGGYCKSGTGLADGASCTPASAGDAGATDAGVATYACVSQVCTLTCTTDEECNDSDVCTGNEICNPSSHTCQSGTPPNCNDNDPCTSDECDALSGCFNPLIDTDGDGHASTTIGSCGTDCDDNDKTVYNGAPELCDGKDNDCNGQTDEGAPTWYGDCDKDGYAPAGAQSAPNLCNAPTSKPTCDTGVTGGWTNKPPVIGSADCWDKDAKGHPMTAAESNLAWSKTPMANAPPPGFDFDFNCDGVEEKRYTTTYVSTSATCSPCGFGGFGTKVATPSNGIGAGGVSGISDPAASGGIGGIGGIGALCCGLTGWTSAAPACGSSGTYTVCTSSGSSCTRPPATSKVQECR